VSRKVVVAIAGASGSIYAKVLLDKLKSIPEQWEKVGVVMSNNAKSIWKSELGNDDWRHYEFDFYEKMDFNAPFASGSANYDTMIIVPCSMGTLSRVATGFSDDLTTRAADVVLKERRKLIVVPRDTPYSLIHIENMRQITLAGGIICPATPSFYSLPKNFEELAATVVDRVLQLAGFTLDAYRWGESEVNH